MLHLMSYNLYKNLYLYPCPYPYMKVQGSRH